MKQDLQRKHRDTLQACASKPHNLKLEQTKCEQEMQVNCTHVTGRLCASASSVRG